jgi:hypothetical protein
MRLTQELLKIPFQDTSSGNVVRALGRKLLKHAKSFGLFEQIGDSRLPHLFREKFERRQQLFRSLS